MTKLTYVSFTEGVPKRCEPILNRNAGMGRIGTIGGCIGRRKLKCKIIQRAKQHRSFQ